MRPAGVPAYPRVAPGPRLSGADTDAEAGTETGADAGTDAGRSRRREGSGDQRDFPSGREAPSRNET